MNIKVSACVLLYCCLFGSTADTSSSDNLHETSEEYLPPEPPQPPQSWWEGRRNFRMDYSSGGVVGGDSGSGSATAAHGHLQPVGSHLASSTPVQVRRHDLPSSAFYSEFIRVNTPVALKGGNRSDITTKEWTDDHVAAAYGTQERVTIFKWKSGREPAVPDSRPRAIKDFIDEMQQQHSKKGEYLIDQSPPDALVNEIVLPTPLLCLDMHRGLQIVGLWFSGGGTHSLIHTDEYENVLMVLSGKKTVKLFHQRHRSSLYFSARGGVESSLSPVDANAVDMQRYPRVSEIASYYEVVLEPGDMLYIPAGYAHQVNTWPGRSLAINLWWNQQGGVPLELRGWGSNEVYRLKPHWAPSSTVCFGRNAADADDADASRNKANVGTILSSVAQPGVAPQRVVADDVVDSVAHWTTGNATHPALANLHAPVIIRPSSASVDTGGNALETLEMEISSVLRALIPAASFAVRDPVVFEASKSDVFGVEGMTFDADFASNQRYRLAAVSNEAPLSAADKENAPLFSVGASAEMTSVGATAHLFPAVYAELIASKDAFAAADVKATLLLGPNNSGIPGQIDQGRCNGMVAVQLAGSARWRIEWPPFLGGSGTPPGTDGYFGVGSSSAYMGPWAERGGSWQPPHVINVSAGEALYVPPGVIYEVIMHTPSTLPGWPGAASALVVEPQTSAALPAQYYRWYLPHISRLPDMATCWPFLCWMATMDLLPATLLSELAAGDFNAVAIVAAAQAIAFRVDASGDGALSIAEVQAATGSADTDAEAVLRYSDSNEDGVLTVAEFIDGCVDWASNEAAARQGN